MVRNRYPLSRPDAWNQTSGATAPSCLCRSQPRICTSVWSACVTVPGSAVVDAAVVHFQLWNTERKLVFLSFERRTVAPSRCFIFCEKKLDFSPLAVLSVPEHGVAAHGEPGAHTALQRHISIRGSDLICRLEHRNRETCSIRRGEFQRAPRSDK